MRQMPLLMLLTTLLLASCSGSIPTKYYQLLSPLSPNQTQDFVTNRGVFFLQPIKIPEIMQRQEIVSYTADHAQVIISDSQIWAGDPQEMISDVIFSNLKESMPSAKVYNLASIDKTAADYQIFITIKEFAGELTGQSKLKVEWLVTDVDKKPINEWQQVFVQEVTEETYTAYVDSLNQLLGQFSTRLLNQLAQLNRSE